MHLEEMEKKDAEFVQPVKKPRIETGNGKKAKRIKSAKEFFGAPSAKCSIEGADMGVLERWLMELGIGWVLHLADGVAAGKLKLDPNHASSWIRALTEITNTFCLMVSLLPGHVSEEEEDAAAAAAMESEYISSLQDLSIIQQAMLKMLAFVDFIDVLPNLTASTCEVVVARSSMPCSVCAILCPRPCPRSGCYSMIHHPLHESLRGYGAR